MPQEAPVTRRTKLFLTAAAAALTLAAGLTVGALLGFVRPPEAAPAAGPIQAAPVEPATTASDAAPLVEGEPVVTAEPRWLGREQEEGREHGELEHQGRGGEEREEDGDD